MLDSKWGEGGCITGPAHAVYFSTYEFVKQKLGGNEGTEHHPLAVGETAFYHQLFVWGVNI